MTELGPVDPSVASPPIELQDRPLELQDRPLEVGPDYSSGWKYRTRRRLAVPTSSTWADLVQIQSERGAASLRADGTVLIDPHFGWDGPSGPALDTPDFMRASLVHDVFYWMMREGKLPQGFRGQADRILREIALEDGMPRIRAWWVWRGVRLGARGAAKRGAETRV